MGVYHQMGHQSENLLWDSRLIQFEGAILSPVNYPEREVEEQIREARERGVFHMIFDPQLYYPTTERGQLPQWRYFPTDVDTADYTSEAWWQDLTDALAETVSDLCPHAACSPAVVPRAFVNDYYAQAVRVGNAFSVALRGSATRPLQTAVVRLQELAAAQRSAEIASILSRTKAEGIYLVIYTDVEPRRELVNADELKGVMRLIGALERAGLPVLTGFSSSDMVLWKAAGASHCATGKFFNLRRFTRGRWEEPSGGAGQLPYWFEESLMGFLREPDLIRVRAVELISDASQRNPFAQEIIQQISSAPGTAWLRLAWRQFLYGFADLERRIRLGETDIDELLAAAENNWLELEDKDVLMEEPRNNGSWIRPWRKAVREYRRGQ